MYPVAAAVRPEPDPTTMAGAKRVKANEAPPLAGPAPAPAHASAPGPATASMSDATTVSAAAVSAGAASSSANPPTEEPAFSFRLSSVGTLITLLNTLLVEKDQLVSISVTQVGAKFAIEKDSTLRAKVYLKATSCLTYRKRRADEPVELCVHLGYLLHCLQVFGDASVQDRTERPLRQGSGYFSSSSSSSDSALGNAGTAAQVELSWAGHGAPLRIVVSEEHAGGGVTECAIKTVDRNPRRGDSDEVNFRSAPIVARLVLKSSFLREAFAEIEHVYGAQVMNLAVSPALNTSSSSSNSSSTSSSADIASSASASASARSQVGPAQPALMVSATGDHAFTRVDLSHDVRSAEGLPVFQEFSCDRRHTFKYSLSLIKPCSRAMAKSDSTMLRINEQGTLSLHHMIPCPPVPAAPGEEEKDSGDSSNWVEFVICSQED